MNSIGHSLVCPETKKAYSKVTEPIILSDYFIIDNLDDKVFLIISTKRHLEVLPVKFKLMEFTGHS